MRRSSVRLTVIILFGTLSVQGELLDNGESAQFLSLGSRSHWHFEQVRRSHTRSVTSDADEPASSAGPVSFDEPVTPPPPPKETPLQPVDGTVEGEIEGAYSYSPSKKYKLKYPTMLAQILELWKFVIWLCGSVAAVMVGSVVFKLVKHRGVLEQQAIKFQVVTVLALLLACPASRALINAYQGAPFWLAAIRNLLEMWLMLLVFCSIPHVTMEYLSRCCRVGDQQMKPAPSDVRFRLSHQTQGQVDEKTRLVLLTSASWNCDSSIEELRQLWKRMGAILALRPLMQICRSISRLGFGVVESWQTSAAFTGFSFLFLFTAVALGILKNTPIIRNIRNATGTPSTFSNLQSVVAALLVVAQAQDFFFLVSYGSEKVGQVFSCVFFMLEICGALLFVRALLSSDPFMEFLKYQVPERQIPFMQRLKLLLKPYPLLEAKTADTAIPLNVRTDERLSSFHASSPRKVAFQEESGLVKRNIWRGVFTDFFADKVRSKTLAVEIAALEMTFALFHYTYVMEQANDWVLGADAGQEAQEALKFVVGLLYVWWVWLWLGLMLLGNNIYYSKWWLLLSISVCLVEVISKLSAFFVFRDPSPSLEDLSMKWTDLFCAAIGAIAIWECIRILLSDEGSAEFYRLERASQRYTSLMLEKVQDGKEHARYAKKKLRPSTAPLLMLGAVATIPVVLALALVALHQGLKVIRYSRIGQCYYQAFMYPPTAIQSIKSFDVLDRDFDLKVSPEEAGISTIFELLGPLAELLVVPMNTLWATVALRNERVAENLGLTTFVAVRNRRGQPFLEEKDVMTEGGRLLAAGANQSLGQDQFHAFLSIMHRAMAIVRSLTLSDVAMAGELLFDTLDTNKDGDLDSTELPLPEIALGLQAVSPHLAHLIAPKLPLVWHEADADFDGKLSLDEFPNVLLEVKKLIMKMEKAIQDMVMKLVLSGMSGMNALPAYAPAFAPGPAFAGNQIPLPPFGLQSATPAVPVAAASDDDSADSTDDFDDGPVAAAPSDAPTMLNDAPSDAPTILNDYNDEGEDDLDDGSEQEEVSMLQMSRHRQRRTKKRQHPEVEVVFVSRALQNHDLLDVAPAPAPMPGFAAAPAPALAMPVPLAVSPQCLASSPVDFITKILIANTGSLGEAFSLLLVAFNAILPDLTNSAQILLAGQTGDLPAEAARVADERWQNPMAYASGTAWKPEYVEQLRTALCKFMESAGPWLQAEGERARLLLTAIAEGAGVSPDDADGSLEKAFAALDIKPKDGKLTFKDLGLHAALALVNPALASYSQDLFNTALGDGLDKRAFSYLLQGVTQILAQFVHDANGDGEADARDVKLVASITAKNLEIAQDFTNGDPSSFMQTWRSTKLRRVARSGGTSQADFNEYVQNVPGGSEVKQKLYEFTMKILAKLVQIFVKLDMDRIEASLYAAGLLSFALGIFVVAMPFLGYTRIYKHLQEGDTSFKGSDCIKELKFRVDFATSYPGILFSTVSVGCIITFFLLFTIFAFVATPSVWVPILKGMKITLTWLTLNLLFIYFLKRVVLDNLCIVDGEVVHPRLFSCIYVMLIILNFALGSLLALTRLVFMLPILFVKFNILSTSLLDSEYVGYDLGYGAFLSMVKQDHDVTNPIRQAFLQVFTKKLVAVEVARNKSFFGAE